MTSFVTRVEREQEEPFTVIFTTDDYCKHIYIENECRKMIGHEKPSADVVEVVRCKDCKWYGRVDKRRFYRGMDCLQKHIDTIVPDRDFCSKAERREE